MKAPTVLDSSGVVKYNVTVLSPHNTSSSTPHYAARCGNLVNLVLRIAKPDTGNVNLATIPLGARPIEQISLRVVSNQTSGAAIVVDTDGSIFTVSAATGDLRINIVYFTNDPFTVPA